METHNFPEVGKVQRFCLTLTSEARLWYETLRPIVVDWTGLQESFGQQYSKFGNTREQLFYVWRSFHYGENTEMIDAYVKRIKQVAALLNYGEPQILALLKHTLPRKLYWILFSINNRRQPQDRYHGCDSRRGSYRCQNYDNRNDSRDRGRQSFRRSFSNDSNYNRNRSRTTERSLTPRENDNRRHDSPNENLGTRNRSNSRVTTNRDRIRCYRCRKYDHFANECPNAVRDDSDRYESEGAVLQLMTAEAEIHDNFDIARANEETNYLNL